MYYYLEYETKNVCFSFEKVKHLNNDRDYRNIILFSKILFNITEFFKTIF